ncbi:hypothetical protein [Marinifilum sp. D714]|uniref:hypothetical protein n=1 Tax=Marinifilum sp. D714 TaxID=2937523 RepID=UPI0027C01ED4|nr:hypothetical protein [Marinifilum sp. D714]MDQ2180119.1 hypothetical protein [Marinifilum sp. D714]
MKRYKKIQYKWINGRSSIEHIICKETYRNLEDYILNFCHLVELVECLQPKFVVLNFHDSNLFPNEELTNFMSRCFFRPLINSGVTEILIVIDGEERNKYCNVKIPSGKIEMFRSKEELNSFLTD